MAHITLSQLRTVLGRIVSWATSKFAARNVTSGKLEYADMPVVVLASMGAELDGTGTDRPMSPGSTYFLPAGGGVGARIMFMDSQGVPAKISDPVSNVIYCNAYTDLLYRWDTAQAKMISVGGTSGGSADVSGKADLLAGADMLTPSQWPKVVLRNVTDALIDDLASGDVYFDSGYLYLYKGSGQNSVSLGTPSGKTIYYCLADGKMYRWNGNSFEAVSLSVDDGKLLRLKTTVIVDEIKANASYDSLPSGKTEYIYYRAGDSKLVRMFLSGGLTVTEVYDPDPRVAYFNKDKGKFMYYFNGQFRNALAIDDEPTEDSSNPVSSGGVYDKLAEKQDKLSAGNGITIAQDGKTVSVDAAIRTNAGKGVADVSSPQEDGSFTITLANGDTYTVNLNHQHTQYQPLLSSANAGSNITITTDQQGNIIISATGGGGGGGISGITMNGNAVTVNNGVADLGTFPISINGKYANGAGLVTLNASDVNAAEVITKVSVSDSGSVSVSLDSGKFYVFNALDSLAINSLNSPTSGMGIYAGKFTASSNWGGTKLSIPATVTEAANNDDVEAGKTYEFSIMDNIIVVKEV